MGIEPNLPQVLKLQGTVVEVLESQGELVVKIAVEPHNLLAVANQNMREAHLGDPVAVEARITVSRVRLGAFWGEENLSSGSPAPESCIQHSQGEHHE
jgi:hypothetical protein